MRTRRLVAMAVAAGSMAIGGFILTAVPASATTCEWHQAHPEAGGLPEYCKPKPTTTTSTKARTTTTEEKATTSTTAEKEKPAEKPVAVKATPQFTG